MSETTANNLISIRFVQDDGAVGRYEMSEESPSSVMPPYGTEVQVIAAVDEWLKIKVFNKIAWMKKHHLCSERPPKRFDFSPYIFRAENTARQISVCPSDQIEFGPRGGRFIRNKSGYRRYF